MEQNEWISDSTKARINEQIISWSKKLACNKIHKSICESSNRKLSHSLLFYLSQMCIHSVRICIYILCIYTCVYIYILSYEHLVVCATQYQLDTNKPPTAILESDSTKKQTWALYKQVPPLEGLEIHHANVYCIIYIYICFIIYIYICVYICCNHTSTYKTSKNPSWNTSNIPHRSTLS